MGRDRLEMLLSRLHQGAPDPSGEKLALRAELVARFRKQFPAQPRSINNRVRKNVILKRLAIAFVLLIGLGAASRAPADFLVEVGKRIEITVRKPAADWPRAPALEPVLQQLGHHSQEQLHATKRGDGSLTLTIELWGQDLAADAAERLRSAFPAMKDAQITVTSLEGKVHGTLGDKLGMRLFHIKTDAATVEAARRELQQQLEDELKAEGKAGKVEVQVEEMQGGKQKVSVKVETPGEPPAQTEDLRPAATRSEPEAVSPAIDSIAQFLLTASATDFHAHRPPDRLRFRDVRIGHVINPSGEEQYLLCGQFLPAQDGSKADWTPFATIKTSGYEQWLGTQAASFCQGPSVKWDNAGDLSSSLQSRLDALRSARGGR